MSIRASATRALSAAAVAACTGAAAASPELRNWFDDPFFAISSAIADCPLPAGPFVDEAERRVQAHRRAEKGTTCWLAGECDRPNAYVYDRDIAAAIRERAPRSGLLESTSLWVTVQGRVVYVEGCAASPRAEADLEAFMRGMPHVQQAIAAIRTDPTARPPYRLRGPRP